MDEVGAGDGLGEEEGRLVVDVGGFESVDLEEDRVLAYAIAPFFERSAGEEVEVGVLFVDGGQVLRAEEEGGVVVESAALRVIEAGLPAGDAEEGVFRRKGAEEGLDGELDSGGAQEGVGAVGLEVVVGGDLGDGVEEDGVHGDRAVAEVLGSGEDADRREVPCGVLADRGAVGVDDDFGDGWCGEECGDDPVVEGFAVEWAEVFVWDTFAGVAHGDERGDARCESCGDGHCGVSSRCLGAVGV